MLRSSTVKNGFYAYFGLSAVANSLLANLISFLLFPLILAFDITPNPSNWDLFCFEMFIINGILYAIFGTLTWLGVKKSKWFFLIEGLAFFTIVTLIGVAIYSRPQ